MVNIDYFNMVISLLGGLALFIFGMNMMSEGLQKTAGEKMKNILGVLTSNPIVGILAGALVTALIQSSSATTVMVIGFISAGLMSLRQAISVILGANIGTTITAQLVAFKIGDYAWLFVIVGFIMYFFLKKDIVKNIGETLFAFGVLFVGLNIMGHTMKPLAATPEFSDMMLQVADIPALGVLVGTVLTALIQSSSASIAVLQNLASTAGPDGVHSVIGLAGAIPILFGTNIGTTVTAMLASIGGTVNAKRIAVAHMFFNIGGTLLFIWFSPFIADMIQSLSGGDSLSSISRQIANAHLSFNIATTLIFLPCIGLLVKFVTKVVPGKDPQKIDSDAIFLDEKVFDTPFVAITLARKEIMRMGEFSLQMVESSRKAFLSGDIKEVSKTLELEDVVNGLQAKITNYISKLYGEETLTQIQAERLSGMLHITADFEHIGDHCKNIVEFAEEKINKKYSFSEVAYKEVDYCFDIITDMVRKSIDVIDHGDEELIDNIESIEERFNILEIELRDKHMKRLNDKKCSPEFTVIYTDIVHNLEKVGDYCHNISQGVSRDLSFFKEPY